MPRIRRRAAAAVLAWMTLGLLASAGLSQTALQANPQTEGQPVRQALAHCHEAAPAQTGAPAREAAPPGSGMPCCQWALPLLCCQQPAAADASSPGLVKLAALWVRAFDPFFVPLASAWRAVPVALPGSSAPPLERSVVLQV